MITVNHTSIASIFTHGSKVWHFVHLLEHCTHSTAQLQQKIDHKNLSYLAHHANNKLVLYGFVLVCERKMAEKLWYWSLQRIDEVSAQVVQLKVQT